MREREEGEGEGGQGNRYIISSNFRTFQVS